MKDITKIKYREAQQELERILEHLDKEEIEVDELAAEIKRAGDLIKTCKVKIEKAEMEVKKVLESFENITERESKS